VQLSKVPLSRVGLVDFFGYEDRVGVGVVALKVLSFCAGVRV
jgi:hypothetical protein